MKRACIVRMNYYPDEPHLRRDAETLLENGYVVDVVCLRKKDQKSQEVIKGISVHRLPLEHHRGGAFRYVFEYSLFFLMSFGWLTGWSFRRGKKVIQVINLPDFLVFAAVVPRLFGAKVALNFFELMPEVFADKLNIELNHPMVKFLYWLEKISATFADHIIVANGICQQKRLEKRGIPASKISSVLNVPDDEFFYPRQNGKMDKTFRLITHGSILERYGVQNLIMAISALSREIPNMEVKIVGEGEYRPQLEMLTKSLGLGDVVRFTGRLPFEEMLALLAKADVGVVSLLPQKQPQMPCKLFEYLAMSKPAVCSALPAVRPYFKDSSVMFYEPDNVEDLKRCLLDLYLNRQKRIDLAASGLAEYQNYRWDRQKFEYLKVFERLMNGSETAPPAEKSMAANLTSGH
jgi:glycosyltransferase involved in cell wall biosynthesis